MLSPPILVLQLLVRIFWSGLNKRNLLTFPLNFFINFLPVLIWLVIFKNAGAIPKDIRPKIHVALAYHVDTFVFSVKKSPVGALLLALLCVCTGWLVYLRWYCPQTACPTSKSDFGAILTSRNSASEFLDLSCGSGLELDVIESPTSGSNASDGSLEMGNKYDEDYRYTLAPTDFQSDPWHPVLRIIPAMSPGEISANAARINATIVDHVRSNGYVPYNSWKWAVPALVAASWPILNLDHWVATPLSTPKDIVSWFSYVIGHFCVPLFTAIWLYVFHAPGALKLFGMALGSQNIAGVVTHLLFPNAPPWFIDLNGENGHADYDTKGYAAGLTRAPFGTGTHMVSKGFHASPIVFGALPSLHLAMAAMSFFFVCYYLRWTVSKVALFAFVVVQWWATIYLRHHWRLDLIVGMLYSVVAFTAVYKWRMERKMKEFFEARLRYDFAAGSTMGMRVFRNTKLQNFFDPCA